MKPVELFHIGPQKSASTWVYQCLREHPEVAAPPASDIFYFDMFYGRGRDWYEQRFGDAEPQQKLFDPTNTYIRSPWAPARIARENPEARLVVCLRDPIERAFSHYWHEKRRGASYEFREVLSNYDLFASWLEPGFYAMHLKRYFEYFSRDQILCQRYETLLADPGAFYSELVEFLGLDPTFRPSLLGRRANEAGPPRDPFHRGMRRAQKTLEEFGLPALAKIPGRWSGRQEYEAGIDPALRLELLEICEPEIRELEELLELDLACWRAAA